MSQESNKQQQAQHSLLFPPDLEGAVNRGGPNVGGAKPGDKGTVIGVISHDGTGLLCLVLSVAPDEMLLLSGNFHSIQQILDEFVFQKVEVVESAGSPFGFHGVVPTDLHGMTERLEAEPS